MDRLFAVSGWLGDALAIAAKLVLAALVVLVVADVTVRNLGLRPIPWAISAAEYALVYAAFLPMPALVRRKGHVFIEFLRAPLGPAARRVLEVAVYVTCMALSAYLAWTATDRMLVALAEGAYQTRTFDMPTSLVYLPMVLGFWLSTVEWGRFLAGRDSLYALDAREIEGF